MPHAKPLPSPLADRPFTVAEAAAQDVPRSRLRARDLAVPFHAVRTAAAADLPRSYAARLARGERFTHTTAAALLGLRMPQGFRESVVHVGAPRPKRAARTAGVVGHQVAGDSPVVLAHGLPVSPPLVTWIQCASLLEVDDLIVMADGLVCRKRPLATIEELEDVVAANPGARGIRKLRRALLDVRAGTDSAPETNVRLIVVRSGLPEPEVNGPILNEHGAVIAHGDLVFRRERVVVEYDGEVHWEREQYVRDIARLDEIIEQGWRVIRVDKGLLARRATFLDKLRRALAASR